MQKIVLNWVARGEHHEIFSQGSTKLSPKKGIRILRVRKGLNDCFRCCVLVGNDVTATFNWSLGNLTWCVWCSRICTAPIGDNRTSTPWFYKGCGISTPSGIRRVMARNCCHSKCRKLTVSKIKHEVPRKAVNKLYNSLMKCLQKWNVIPGNFVTSIMHSKMA